MKIEKEKMIKKIKSMAAKKIYIIYNVKQRLRKRERERGKCFTIFHRFYSR